MPRIFALLCLIPMFTGCVFIFPPPDLSNVPPPDLSSVGLSTPQGFLAAYREKCQSFSGCSELSCPNLSISECDYDPLVAEDCIDGYWECGLDDLILPPDVCWRICADNTDTGMF